MRLYKAAILTFLLVTFLPTAQAMTARERMEAYDIKFLDSYLQSLSNLVMKGNTEEKLFVTTGQSDFEREILNGIKKHDKSVPARLVLYAALKKETEIEADGKVGSAIKVLSGESLSPIVSGNKKIYTFEQIQKWWSENQKDYEPLPALDKWSKFNEQQSAYKIEYIDSYLRMWDKFAQGDNAAMQEINIAKPTFERHLTNALVKGDKGAPARFVFMAVVTVGLAVPYDAPMATAFRKMCGDSVPKTEYQGASVYFAGDLYFWWIANKEKYDAFPLFDEWAKRDFAIKTVIPGYERIRKNEEATKTPNNPPRADKP